MYNGEFKLTNYGLVDAETLTFKFPRSMGDHDIEMLSNIPDKLRAMQSITVAYRVTRRTQTASRGRSLYEEVMGYGGGTDCDILSEKVEITGTHIICPSTPNERTATKVTDFLVTILTDCSDEELGWGDGIPGDLIIGWEDSPYKMIQIPYSTSTPISLGDCQRCSNGQISILPDGTILPDDNLFDCQKRVCRDGQPAYEPNDDQSCISGCHSPGLFEPPLECRPLCDWGGLASCIWDIPATPDSMECFNALIQRQWQAALILCPAAIIGDAVECVTANCPP